MIAVGGMDLSHITKAKLKNMIVLKHTKTHESCPKCCKGISYLNDDQVHKNCIVCGIKWNRLTNKVVKK